MFLRPWIGPPVLASPAFDLFGLAPLVAIAAGLLVSKLIAWASEQKRQTEEAWQAAAGQLGLEYLPGSTFRTRKMQGVIEGFPVVVDTFTVSNGKSSSTFTRAVLRSAPGAQLNADLTLKREGAGTALAKLVKGEDIHVGDPDFDDTVNLRGPELEVRAMMTETARSAVIGLLARGSVMKPGQLYLQKGGVIADRELLVASVRSMATAAKHLGPVPPAQIPERLASIATVDPKPGVRVQALSALQQFASHPEAQRAGSEALTSESPEIRFLGARLCSAAERGPVLEALLAPSVASPELRAQVLDLLRQSAAYAASPVPASVREALDDSDLRVQQAAIDVLGPLDSDLQPRVIDLLGHESTAVREKAAQALGRLGSVEAVEPLLALTSGLLTASALKEAGRDSVRRIQARLGDVGAGRLAVVESAAAAGSRLAAAGELSLVSEVSSPAAAELPGRVGSDKVR